MAVITIHVAVRFTQGATVGKTPVYCMKMAKCAQYTGSTGSMALRSHNHTISLRLQI